MPNSGKQSKDLKGYSDKSPIARVVGYAENVGKEVKQYVKSYTSTVGASYDAKTYPPEQRAALADKANQLSDKNKSDLGQVIGAVLQGRRYDSKGVRK
jgi:hypothetical protein